MVYEYTILGMLVGPIWIPACEACKEVVYSFVRKEADKAHPFVGVRETLREAVLHVTNDRDFQSCELRNAVLKVVASRKKGTRTVSVTRYFALEKFSSVTDMVSAEEYYMD